MKEKNLLPPISKLTLSALVHATENESKVRKAINALFSSPLMLKILITSQLLRGHYRNPITILNMTVRYNDKLDKLLEYLFLNLKENDKTLLYNNISLYYHKNTFYLRLDKQAAVQGILSLNQEDSIKVQFTFRHSSKNKNIGLILKRLLRNEKIC
jgi:RNA binding exosome subunit